MRGAYTERRRTYSSLLDVRATLMQVGHGTVGMHPLHPPPFWIRHLLHAIYDAVDLPNCLCTSIRVRMPV